MKRDRGKWRNNLWETDPTLRPVGLERQTALIYLAQIEDAVLIFQRFAKHGFVDQQTVTDLEWVMLDLDEAGRPEDDGHFAFVRCCYALGANPVAVRSALRRSGLLTPQLRAAVRAFEQSRKSLLRIVRPQRLESPLPGATARATATEASQLAALGSGSSVPPSPAVL